MRMALDLTAFLDELEKISAAGKIPFSRVVSRAFQKRVGKSVRVGTRPQSVATLLKRHAGGTFKHKLSEYNPTMGNASAPQAWMIHELAAKAPKHRGDVPSRDDIDGAPKKLDGRDSAVTIYGPGSQAAKADVTNSPAGNN